MTNSRKYFNKTIAIFVSFILILTCGIFPTPLLRAETASLCNPNGVYLCEAFNIAGGNLYNQPRSQWIKFLDKYSANDYYLGTPFDDWLYSASPRGDRWQLDEGYSYSITSGGGSAELGGLNSTGFIWHTIAKSLSEASGLDISVTGKWVPNLNGFNYQGFSRSCWQGGNNRWYDFINQYNVKYYEFYTKSDMLASGVLGKGDIIWCVDGAVGSLMNGLSIPADNHHVGIYMGNGSDDVWWQTGPVYGDGNTSAQYNSINPIYGCAYYSTYIVLPWDGVHTDAPPSTPNEHSTRTVTHGLKNPEGYYFNHAFTAASGGSISMSLSQWQSFIDQYTSNDYYIGTPYSEWLYASCPRGDLWQYYEGCKGTIVNSGGSPTDGGLNCMAFVWHAISNGLAVTNGTSIGAVSRYVPFNDDFNYMFTRQSWSGTYSGWLDYLETYNIRYYEFSTKAEMLGSGALRKGDIIWCVDRNCGTGLNGLRLLSDFHHIGIYTGNGYTDQWWQSGPTLGDHIFDNQKNSVNPIYGCALYNTYVVIPFADELVRDVNTTTSTTTTTTTTSTTTTTTSTTTTTTSTTTTTTSTTTTTTSTTTTTTSTTTTTTSTTTTTTSTTTTTTSTTTTTTSTTTTTTSTTTTTTSTTTTTTSTTTTTTTAAPSVIPTTSTSCAVSLKEDARKLMYRKGLTPKDIISAASKDGAPVSPEELSFGDSDIPQLEFVSDGKTFTCLINIYLGSELLASPAVASVLKGDANMDGKVDSVDASIVLACYAKLSVGESWSFTDSGDELDERLSYLAADIDTETVNMCIGDGCKIDSSDASRILRYYSLSSTENEPEW